MSNRVKKIIFLTLFAVFTIAYLIGFWFYIGYFYNFVNSGPVLTLFAGTYFFGVVGSSVCDLWLSIFHYLRKKNSPAPEV